MTLYCCNKCKVGAPSPCLCKEPLPYREIPDTNDTKVLLDIHDDDNAEIDVKSQNEDYESMAGLIHVKHHNKQLNPIQNNENGDTVSYTHLTLPTILRV